MTQTPLDPAPQDRPDGHHDGHHDGPGGPDEGPRVSRDDVRDLTRLRRSRDDRKVAGVAAGIARHLDIDPLVVRVTFVVLVFFGGAGAILYGATWLLVPDEGSDEAPVRLDDRSRTVALVVVGVVAVLALLGDSVAGWGFPWPLVVIGVLVLGWTLLKGDRPSTGSHPGPPAESHPTYDAVPPAYAPSTASPGRTYPGTTYPGTTYPGASPRPRSPRRGGPLLFGYAVALTVLGWGVLGTVDLAGADVPASGYPALALVVCGALLLLGAFWGRAGGLILIGLVAAVATAGTTLAGEVDGGRISATPTSAASVADDYTLTAGRVRLDLTRVGDLDALDGRSVDVDLDVGRVEVIVPRGLDVDLESRVDLGDRRVLGDRDPDSDATFVDGGASSTVGATAGNPTLDLDVTVGIGEIVITQEAAR